MNESIDIQMLSALEFFHYSQRFQNHLFVLALEDDVDLKNLITDLRVINASSIQMILVCNYDLKLKDILDVWKLRGCPFVYFSMNPQDKLTSENKDQLEKQFKSSNIPVIGLSATQENENFSTTLGHFSMELVSHFTVDKVFFLSTTDGLYINEAFISHLTPQEASKHLEKPADINIGMDRLRYFVEQNLENGVEIVLLEGQSGCLFQEIFTHRGKGSLLTSDYPNTIRTGELADVLEISILMKPYIQSGTILPVTEDEVAKEIQDYYVYSVNNSIVASAKLTHYDSAVELAKFCTLPRYQGKGRARELAERMIQEVKETDKDMIFALTVEPKMVVFFKSLGFEECDRNSLPKEWLEKYDMQRSSKAFALKIPR
jgi:N-acetylglutamate synthase-like GNAT family acetyltransferase